MIINRLRIKCHLAQNEIETQISLNEEDELYTSITYHRLCTYSHYAAIKIILIRVKVQTRSIELAYNYLY